MSPEYKQKMTLSLFINTIKDLLTEEGFFEHHLYSTISYKIENTDSFKIKEGFYLRYNPEPDIWQVGRDYDKFFWIGSMFRDEKKLSPIHQREFTVVDIYQDHATMETVVEKFFNILKTLETELKLSLLPKNIKYILHSEFNNPNIALQDNKGWYAVTNYPIEESFYDIESSKFEIFYVDGKKRIEIGVAGKLGENLNPINYVKGRENTLDSELVKKEFMGFGIGLERLISLYTH